MKYLKLAIAFFSVFYHFAAYAEDVDEAELYKALMKQQLLSQQQAAQQQLQASTIESIQAQKIARLKAQLAANQQQAPVYAQPQTQTEAQQQTLQTPYVYRGQPYNIHPLQPMSPLQRSVIPDNPPAQTQQPTAAPDNRTVAPVTVPTQESLAPGEEEEEDDGMTPAQRAQEKYETEHSQPAAPTAEPADDPLGIKPSVYRPQQRIISPVQVRYMQPVMYRQVAPQQVVYVRYPQRVIYQQPQQIQRVVYLSR